MIRPGDIVHLPFSGREVTARRVYAMADLIKVQDDTFETHSFHHRGRVTITKGA